MQALLSFNNAYFTHSTFKKSPKYLLHMYVSLSTIKGLGMNIL